jgi:AraC-like DNA-binding protein
MRTDNDALSSILQVVHLTSAVFFNAKFTAPWCYASPPSSTVIPHLAPGADHLVIYHLISEGECSARVEGADPVSLAGGDLVIFPHGDAHMVGTDFRARTARPERTLELLRKRGLRLVQYGGGGAVTRFVCGYLACDLRLCRSLLDALPPVVRVRLRRNGAPDWLEASIRYAVEEARSPRPGGRAVLAKLSEVLFVEALRRYLDSLPPGETGWLAGLRDRHVGRALALMHARPAHPWTVDMLAREIGCSRSIIAGRFTHFLGRPPMQYLTHWRLTLAAAELRASRAGILAIAQQVGYDTDAALNRAFKREFGVPPAAWRRRQRPS